MHPSRLLIGVVLLLPVASAVADAPDEPGAPRLERLYTVAPDIVAVDVAYGHVSLGRQEPYHAEPGDVIEESGPFASRYVKRHDALIGALVGADDNLLVPFDAYAGAVPEMQWAESPSNTTLSALEDADFKGGRHPEHIWRKSRPTGLARLAPWTFAVPGQHTLYFKFAGSLKGGREYHLRFAGDRLPEQTFRHDPYTTRSEAVHVSQVGFRSDDPVKLGFLSIWLGNGGAHTYDRDLNFHLVDESSGRTVFRDRIARTKAASAFDEDSYERNYNGTDVYRLDFSAFHTPGRYRLYVQGTGCSFPFRIDDAVWRDALVHAARGLYHQRSGIALGPPYTTFTRPRAFHPDDGMHVRQSTCALMNSGNGLNARGTDRDNFGNLVAGMTDTIVTNAWGGYFDAGDWDRRIQHLEASRLLLELAELFPDFIRNVDLNIPESVNDIPDLVDEAMWNIDFYRRLQDPDGGVRGGIESAEHPRLGEGSWQESLPVMAYAPGLWSSYVYAGDAARLAGVLQQLGLGGAEVYHESALRAMDWAERELGSRDDDLPHAVNDARNLAAAELFRLSGESRWNQVFVDTTAFKEPGAALAVWQHHDQRDAAFVFVRTRQPGADADIKWNARNAILREANASIRLTARTAFGWTKLDPWIPVGWGALTTPQIRTIVRAHALTGDAPYLQAALLACQTGAGANPLNLCYTTGYGARSPQHPLCVDARVLAVPPPPGLTVFGPMDVQRTPDYVGYQIVADSLYPPIAEWPTMEAYFDIYMSPQTTEFTVPQTLGPNIHAWGYLAACAR